MLAQSEIYGIITSGATSVREAGQGRNPAALSDVGCVLFFDTAIWLLSLGIRNSFQILILFKNQKDTLSRVLGSEYHDWSFSLVKFPIFT